MKGSLWASAWLHRSLLIELIRREFLGRYRGTFGGVMWSFAYPLFLLAVYTVAFGVILQVRWSANGGATEYALMLFAGLIIFNAFSEVLSKSTSLVTANPNFVKKILFPLELLPFIEVAVVTMHVLIGVAVWLVGYVMFVGFPKASVLLFPLVILCLVPVLLGAAWLLAATGVIVRDIGQLTALVTQGLLFLTPLFYNAEMAPKTVQLLLRLNPLTFLIEQFRAMLFGNDAADFLGIVIYFLAASVFAWMALAFFRRLRPSFADLV